MQPLPQLCSLAGGNGIEVEPHGGVVALQDNAVEVKIGHGRLRLHQALWPRLQQTPPLDQVLTRLEVPLLSVLSRMERSGVKLDSAMLAKQSRELAERMHELEQQAYGIAGRSFNMGSPKQIGQIFFEELELPVIAKTPKGAPSTAESVLQELADQGHELPGIILQHRGLSKLRSTYTDKLPELVDANGRLHTSYHQAVAATGRLSSSDPNLQNIPVRSELGRKIRSAFVAGGDDLVLLAADYSQIELRVIAHVSGDAHLKEAFARRADIHRETAARVLHKEPADVTADERYELFLDGRRLGRAAPLPVEAVERLREIDGVGAEVDDLDELEQLPVVGQRRIGLRPCVPAVGGNDDAGRRQAGRVGERARFDSADRAGARCMHGAAHVSVCRGDHLALVKNVGIVTNTQGLTDVVVGNQHADIPRAQLFDDLLDINNGDRVDTGKDEAGHGPGQEDDPDRFLELALRAVETEPDYSEAYNNAAVAYHSRK